MKNKSEAKAHLLKVGDSLDALHQLEMRTQQLMELSEKYSEVSDKLVRLQSEHEELSARLRNWSSALAKADAEIDRLRAERLKLVAARIQLSRMEQSRSWRMTALLRSAFRRLVGVKQGLRAVAIKLLIPSVRLVIKVPGARALVRKILANHPGLKLRLSKVADMPSPSQRRAGSAALHPAMEVHSRFTLSESENEAYAFLKNCRHTKGKAS